MSGVCGIANCTTLCVESMLGYFGWTANTWSVLGCVFFVLWLINMGALVLYFGYNYMKSQKSNGNDYQLAKGSANQISG